MDRDQVLFRLFGKFCPEGTILYTEGSPGAEAYLVQSGTLRVSAERAVREVGPGGVIGEEAVLERAPRRERAEARSDARLIQVSGQTLEGLARNGPAAIEQLVLALAGVAARELRAIEAWALARALDRAQALLAEATAGPVPREEFVEHGGGHDARRLLDELVARGAIGIHEGMVRVADRGALAAAAGAIAAGGGEA